MVKTIVCFGDSNTHGYCAETGSRFTQSERWTCLLQKRLGEEYHILEEGLGGRTTVFDDPLFEGLNGLAYIHPCLMSHEPVDLLIIMLGTNDTKDRFGANAHNIGQGMERLVKKAKAADAWRNGPNILIIAPPPIEDAYIQTAVAGPMGVHCAEKSRRLAGHYEEKALLCGCHFLDAGKIDGIKMNTVDYMHLDKESHRLMAKKLAELIPELLA